MESRFIFMDSTLQDLSNDTRIAQFEVRTRKLWHPEAEEEKQTKPLIILTLPLEFSHCSVNMLSKYQ